MLDVEAERLRGMREQMKREMGAALRCRTKAQKIKLVEKWKRLYEPIVWEQYLACARVRSVMVAIANWDLYDFEGQRRKCK